MKQKQVELMPDRIEVCGRWYVAEDAIMQPSIAVDEHALPVKQLCEEYGVNPHRAYDAINAGLLEACLPFGCKKGKRIYRADFVAWLDGKTQPSG